jgi:hypothetical protein
MGLHGLLQGQLYLLLLPRGHTPVSWSSKRRLVNSSSRKWDTQGQDSNIMNKRASGSNMFQRKIIHVKLLHFTNMKSIERNTVFCVLTPCSSGTGWRFEGTHSLYLHGRRLRKATNQQWDLLATCFMLVSSSPYFSALKTDAICSFATPSFSRNYMASQSIRPPL